jgi:hypothetical protein
VARRVTRSDVIRLANNSLVLVFVIALLGGCAAKVGDACETSTDCGTQLSCETSQTDGYCTITPCEVNGCPDEAVCIVFPDDSTFCMARCDAAADCRDGYVCVDNFGDAPFCNNAPYTAP